MRRTSNIPFVPACCKFRLIIASRFSSSDGPRAAAFSKTAISSNACACRLFSLIYDIRSAGALLSVGIGARGKEATTGLSFTMVCAGIVVVRFDSISCLLTRICLDELDGMRGGRDPAMLTLMVFGGICATDVAITIFLVDKYSSTPACSVKDIVKAIKVRRQISGWRLFFCWPHDGVKLFNSVGSM